MTAMVKLYIYRTTGETNEYSCFIGENDPLEGKDGFGKPYVGPREITEASAEEIRAVLRKKDQKDIQGMLIAWGNFKDPLRDRH